jgi:hypothetical protein
MRLTVRPVTPGKAIFVGFGPSSAVDTYLAGTAHDQVVDIGDRGAPRYRTTAGDSVIDPPTGQTFWTSKATGTGPQQVDLRPSSGSWAVVVMNADGSPGVDVVATVGVRAGFLLPLALTMMVVGLLLAAAGVALIVRGAAPRPGPAPYGGAPYGGAYYGAYYGSADRSAPEAPTGSYPPPSGQRADVAMSAEAPPSTAAGASGVPPAVSADLPGAVPAVVPPGAVPGGAVPGAVPAGAAGWPAEPALRHPRAASPVTLDAQLDDGLSRWLWLVKWFLAIPHLILLGFLWVAFGAVWVVAFFAILFTGQYPRGLFEFNLGVLRWTWRVQYYCGGGGLGTDRYPPFTLDDVPDYPARLDIAYRPQLSRGLVLVKWWLLAIPHYLIVGLLVGGGWGLTTWREQGWRIDPVGGGILGLLVVVAGVFLLFSGHYPRSLFDLVIGLNRWVYRVIAYAALMTDVYPPFQLDEGGMEHPAPPPWQPPGGGSTTSPESVGGWRP